MPWLTPDNADAPIICRRVFVPLQFLTMVSGALELLTKPYNWEKFGELEPEECAEIMTVMWMRWFESGDASMIGSIVPFMTASPPDGALECDGGAYLREDYPSLYEVLDDFFKVDADNFVVPDLRGRTVIGTGEGSGLTARSIGDEGGEEDHELTTAELAAHSHTDLGHTHSIELTTDGLAVAPGELPVVVPIPLVPGSTGSGSANLTDAGENEPHNNMQPFYALRYCVIAR